jgi:thiol-disulfide isomerase/thioredoxin
MTKSKRRLVSAFSNAIVALPIAGALGFAAWIHLQPSPSDRLAAEFQLRAGDPAPDLRLAGGSGSTRRLSDYTGAGPIAVVIVDPDCGYCRTEMENLTAIVAAKPAHAERFVVVAVGDPARIAELTTEFPALDVQEDRDRSLERTYRLPTVPALFTLDASGQVAEVRFGLQSERQMSTLLDGLR